MARPTLYTAEMYAEYARKGYWDDLTLSDYWDRNAATRPDGEAVADHRVRLTWSQAKHWIDNTALGLLALGLKRDSVVVIQLPNRVELPMLRMCCEKAGLICLPVLRSLREKEIEYVLGHSGAEAVIIPREFRGFDYYAMISQMRPRLPALKHLILAGGEGDRLESPSYPLGSEGDRLETTDRQGRLSHPVALEALGRGDMAGSLSAEYLVKTKYPATEFSLVLSTSGSTGVPKFVEHPICSRAYLGRAYMSVTGLTSQDVVAVLAPAFVGPNSLAYYGAPQAAASIVMLEHFDAPSALRLIEREHATIIGVVPTQLSMILALLDLEKYELKSLRLVICTGAPLPYRVALEAEEKLGAPLIQFYGNVDGGGSTFPSLDDSAEIRHLTVGKAIPGDDIKLIDDNGQPAGPGGIGEVLVRGATIVSGYYQDPAMNAACWTPDGFFKTGDYGKWDEQGNLLIVGRKKEMIIRGGQNIYPAEIENLLVTHPAVREVAVVGMPDSLMGEKACAFVVLKESAGAARPAVPESGPPCDGSQRVGWVKPAAGWWAGVGAGEPTSSDLSFAEMTSFLKQKGIAAFKLPERLEIVDRLPTVAGEQKVNKPALREAIAGKLAEEAGAGR